MVDTKFRHVIMETMVDIVKKWLPMVDTFCFGCLPVGGKGFMTLKHFPKIQKIAE